MAEIKTIPIGEKLRISNPKINQNFQNLNNEIAANKTDADNKLEAHKNSTTAHPAQSITYQGVVATANDAKDAIDKTYTRISEIVAQSGDSNTEIVDSRGEYPVLGDRLNASDARLADIAYNVKAFGAVGDGVTDDTTAIKNAIAAAGAKGGRVRFPAGTFIYSSYMQPPSNITIEGVKGATVIKMKPDVLPTFGFFNVGNINNVVVRDIKFVGNKVDPTTPGTAEPAMFLLGCSDILIENCEFTGYMGIGIAFQGGKNTKVIGCKFYDHGQNLTAWRGMSPKSVPAVWAAYGNEGLVVEDCDFDDCRWSAVFMLGKKGSVNNCRIDNVGESSIYSESSAEYPTEYNSATNNKISNAYMVDVTACGIEWATPNSVIADNVITSCGGDGIAIANCSYLTVENNIISNCNKEGFTFGGGIGLALKDGITLPKQGKGISINNNICYDDQAVKTQKYGIYVTNYGGSGSFTDCSIANNILKDNRISDFFIDGNVFSDPSNKFTDEAWHSPELLNGWVEFGGGYNPPGYAMDRGRVHLKGFIKNGTASANTVLFNLPLAYRPQNNISVVSISNAGGTATPITIEILTNGNVRIGAFSSGTNWLILDSISFSI